jgi:hypothetical protein
MPSTYDKIATTTLGSAGKVTFASIPSTYTDLVLIFSGQASNNNIPVMTFNSDIGTNYSQTSVSGSGSSASSFRNSGDDKIRFGATGTGKDTNIFNFIVQIMNYSNTTTNKTVIGRLNAANSETTANVGLWRNTAAISRIDLETNFSNNFATGSTFTLYGIKAA